MRELIRGYGAATFDSAEINGNLAKVVEDLTVFAQVLSRSESLRNALTDSTIGTEVRRDIVSDLLAERASAEATTLLSYTIRFERPSELPTTVIALLAQAEQYADVSSITDSDRGAVLVRERVTGYAERVLQEVGSSSEIDEIEDELFRFSRIVDSSAPLRHALSDMNASTEVRNGILSDLLSGKVAAPTLRIARYVLGAGRCRDLVGVFEHLVDLAAAERGRRVAQVRTAVTLDDDAVERLSSALARLVDRQVEVRQIADPSVIGGILIAVGDLVIDGTVRIRFERLRDLLAKAS